MNNNFSNPSNFSNPVLDSLQNVDSFVGLTSSVKDLGKDALGAALVGTNEISNLVTTPPVGSVFKAPLAIEYSDSDSFAYTRGDRGNRKKSDKEDDISGSNGTVNPLAAMDGVFTVGSGGLMSIDVLADNGAYQGQLGVFSLNGMENFRLGSAEFIEEAARRAIDGNGEGYLLFDDATEDARFNSQLGEQDCNGGSYNGVKTVGFEAGEKVALILVPNGSLESVADGNFKGSNRPLFSMSAANKGATQFAKVSTNVFGWEDIALKGGRSNFSDADYNDIVIKVSGATGQATELSQILKADRNWLQTESAQNILTFANKSNAVLGWNQAALDAIKIDKTNPPIASRNLAILETAVFDAVNGLTAFYDAYKIDNGISPDASVEAAASQAAYRVLTELYPNQKATFDGILNGYLQDLPAGDFVTKGLAYGKAVAEGALASRANDGSKTVVPYIVSTEIGKWQPTSAVASPLLPQWGKVTPFALESSGQFRPDAPPALDSDEYTQDFNRTKDIGSLNSTTRTADQTEIAKFWADGGGTYTPPGHWNSIATQLLSKNNASLVESAHTLGVLNIALADAAIACWDAKYTFDAWRPVTAIRQAALDGNDATTADTTWQPLIATPPFPEYTSGHSTFSSTAATVLTELMGKNVSFTTSSIGLPGVTRSFTSFQQAAQEAGISRIYSGIHFMSANTSGLECGEQIGDYVINKFMQSKTAS
jgi:membrane-associated phospholipid phosphatase